jgi:hypothetical protein
MALMGALLWSAVVGPFIVTLGGSVMVCQAPGDMDDEREAAASFEIVLPASLDPLSPRRRLSVNAQGLIQRADYVLNLVPGLAVVETMSAYDSFGGIRIPTLRRIAPAGATRDVPALIDIEIFDVTFS